MKKQYLYLTILTILLFFTLVIKLKLSNEAINVSVSMNEIDVDALSCILLDTKDNKIIYAKNIYERLLPASITKILTCITAIENYPLDNYVYITEKMINVEGSKIYLQVGDFISIRDLLYGLMLNSGNDAAAAIASLYSGKEEDFIYLMNKTARKIGMTKSIFTNPSGLDSKSQNYTTAYDMALLMSYALKNPTFRMICNCKNHHVVLHDKTLYFHHKHRLIHQLDNVTGGKTGYTKKAGRTLVTSFINDQTEIVVVTFKSHQDWFIHKNLANTYFNSINSSFYKQNVILQPLKPLLKRSKGDLDD